MTQQADTNQGFVLNSVAFFGRTLNEYTQMFNLDLKALKQCKVLDCPSGPASFVAEANRQGIDVVGCDPLYEIDINTLTNQGRESIESCIAKTATVSHLFHMDTDELRESFKQEKLRALQRFSEDFPTGKDENRYLVARLPNLPFSDKSFDVALSSYLLFVYADKKHGGMLDDSPFDYDFHLNSIIELTRVAKREVRIYPLQGPNTGDKADEAKQFLQKLILDLKTRNITSSVEPVSYKDIKGANQMLHLTW